MPQVFPSRPSPMDSSRLSTKFGVTMAEDGRDRRLEEMQMVVALVVAEERFLRELKWGLSEKGRWRV